MDAIRHYLTYVVLIAFVIAAIVIVPRCARVTVPTDYNEIDGIVPYTSYPIDTSVRVTQLRIGDAICYETGEHSEQSMQFGWIAALPGDEVAIDQGMLLVNNKEMPHSSKILSPRCAPIRIPEHHFFVVTSSHEHDSIAIGPLPAIALRGRLGKLP